VFCCVRPPSSQRSYLSPFFAAFDSHCLRCASSTQQHAGCKGEGAADDNLNDGVGKLSNRSPQCSEQCSDTS